MGRRRKTTIGSGGAAECVNTTDHWIFRGDPREAAKTWKPGPPGSDRETWFSMDYDDRLRFSVLVDPWALTRMRGRAKPGVAHVGRSPFPWWMIALITGHSKGCLERRPCRLILLCRIKKEWYDLNREVLGKVEEEGADAE